MFPFWRCFHASLLMEINHSPRQAQDKYEEEKV
jgi:hypothetical protein